MSTKTNVISLDFETRSESDLKREGSYKYAHDQSTQVLCLAVSVNDTIRLWLPDNALKYVCPSFWSNFDPITTQELMYHVTANTIFTAHNANFERNIWAGCMVPMGFPPIPLRKWRCTAAKAAAVALPRSLDEVSLALGLSERKDKEGHRLMMKWCKPRQPSASNPSIWHSDPHEFIRLCQYCVQDVVVEKAVDASLPDLSYEEQEMWFLDQKINDTGVCVDVEDIENLQDKVREKNKLLMQEVPELGFAGIHSTNQAKKIIELLNYYGIETDTINAEFVKELLERDDLDPSIRRLMEIRQRTSKSSVTKLETMKRMAQHDGRVRGSILYHGAATGRWAAKGLQLHNYPRTNFKDDDIEEVCDMSLFDLEAKHGAVHTVVSKALRGMIRAPEYFELYNFDFSNIEGRLAAWIAGEQWKTDSFVDYDNDVGPDNYILAYSRAYNVPIDKVTDDQRQVGKTMELALQFQGWTGALMGMAEKFGIIYDDDLATELCAKWRDAHPYIKKAWYTIGDTAIAAVKQQRTYKWRNIVIGANRKWLRVRLPSGRVISYYRPYIAEKDHYGQKKEIIGYHGVHRVTRNWSDKCSTHGGDIFQSIVQGTARDNLAFALKNLDAAGFSVVMHVHDEVSVEQQKCIDRYDEMKKIMSMLPPWAEGLPLAVSGWRGQRYRK